MSDQEIILKARVTDRNVENARKFIESCEFTTSAVRALVEAMRQQYADAVTEGLRADRSTPCADILASILPSLAAAEAEEV